MSHPNTFTEDDYQDMWCRHRFTSDSNYSGAPVTNDYSRCVGRDCPALVITRTEKIQDEERWIGLCGADHPNRLVAKE